MNWYHHHKFAQLPANWTEELREHVLSAISTTYAPASDVNNTRPGEIFWQDKSQRIGSDYAAINMFFNGVRYRVNIRDTGDLAHMWEASGAELLSGESLVGTKPITGIVSLPIESEGEAVRYFAAKTPFEFTQEMEKRILEISNGDDNGDDTDGPDASGPGGGDYDGGGHGEWDDGYSEDDLSRVPMTTRPRFEKENQ